MVGWNHQLDGHKFEQDPGVGDGLGRLACSSPWGHKELDMTEWTELTEEPLVSQYPSAACQFNLTVTIQYTSLYELFSLSS